MENKQKIITFRSTELFYSHLIMKSHQISLIRKENLTVSDIIREALEKEFPFNDSSNKETGDNDNGKKRIDLCGHEQD